MSPDTYFSLTSKRSEVICPETTKKRVFVTPLCLTPNCYATRSSIFISLIGYRLKVDPVGYICVMHVTRYYFIGCHSAQYHAERFSAAGGIEPRGNVQRGIVTKPLFLLYLQKLLKSDNPSSRYNHSINNVGDPFFTHSVQPS